MKSGGVGRRAGSPDTRNEILDAARFEFAENGYAGATIRGIARRAGVDPALVHHYFGTKDGLFAESIDLPGEAVRGVLGVIGEGSDDIGRRLAYAFFAVWEDEQARSSLLGIIRSALGGEDQAVMAFRQFLTTRIVEQIAPHISGGDQRLRALLMASQLVGVALTRYVMRLEPIATAPIEDIVDLVAPRIQSYVDDPAA